MKTPLKPGRLTPSAKRRSAICGVLLFGIAGVFSVVALKDRFVPRRWAEVEEGKLFRSGQLHPALVESTLREHGIRDIVVLTRLVPGDVEQEAEADAVASLRIASHRFPLRGDGTGSIENYADALSAISEALVAGRPCLVHCTAGTERTGLTVAFFRILMEGRSRQQAVEEMIAAGTNPARNKTILPYLDSNLPILRKMLVERGVAVLPLAAVPRPSMRGAGGKFELVRPAGVEPTTFSFGG